MIARAMAAYRRGGPAALAHAMGRRLAQIPGRVRLTVDLWLTMPSGSSVPALRGHDPRWEKASGGPGVRARRPRVLFVNTLSLPLAAFNLGRLARAYGRVAEVETFDYLGLARRYGPRLMNRLLERTALRFQPDLIHLGKCEFLTADTVRRIKAATSACVAYVYGDVRWELPPYVVEIGREADHTFFQHRDPAVLRHCAERGVRSIRFWQSGVDPDVFRPKELTPTHDLAFMANNPPPAEDIPGAAERREFVEAVAAKGWDLHLYGDGWEHLAGRPNVARHPLVDGDDFAAACAAARITLGFGTDRFYLYTSWPRPLKCMASGAFHLTRYFPGLETIFQDREHLVWFRSLPEALDLIEHYLARPEARARIAAAGREEVLRRHTWDARVAEMLALLADPHPAAGASASPADRA